MVAAQPALASPSETVTLSWIGPGPTQTNVGVAEVGLLKDPEGDDQE
jgi:hypothetical protein